MIALVRGNATWASTPISFSCPQAELSAGQESSPSRARPFSNKVRHDTPSCCDWSGGCAALLPFRAIRACTASDEAPPQELESPYDLGAAIHHALQARHDIQHALPRA